MDSKSIFKSKTFWANALGPLFLWLAAKGVDLSPDDQAALITVVMMIVNIVLRSITKQPVHVVTPPAVIVLPALAFALMALSACAQKATTISSAANADPLTVLASFTVADLQAASDDAHANNDPAHSWTCWDYLAGQVAALKPPSGQKTVGAFLAFQKARDLANGVQSATGALAGLNVACAAVVIDTQTTLNKLALLAAGTAATGGALAPFAPALPAIGATLPIALP